MSNESTVVDSTTPTDEQITAMLDAIFGMSDQAKATDNEALHAAHVDVLQNRLSPDATTDKYGKAPEDGDAPFGGDDFDSLFGTAKWHSGQSDPDDDSPSESLAAIMAEIDAEEGTSDSEGDGLPC